MRRWAMLVAVCGAATLIAAPAANATFHETKVTEVLTSNAATTAQQFVELQDPAEPYPAANGPYWLVVYDATGTALGSQELDAGTLRTDAALGPMLISTSAYDTAAATTGEFALTVSLPAAAGQACFAYSAAKSPVQCITWGTITTHVGALFPYTGGGSPGDGQSLQTQCDGTAAFGAPTPGTANALLAPACTNTAPTARFTAAPAAPTAGQAITFDGSSSTDPDAGDHVASWHWSFDGTAVVTTTPTVSRTLAAGAHTVTLTVVDGFGTSSSPASQTITVGAAAAGGGGGGGAGGGGGGTGGPAGGGPAKHTFSGVSLHATSVRASASGSASFTVKCPAGTSGACAGKLTLKDGSHTVAAKSFSIKPGKSATVKLTLSRAERSKLRRKHSLKLALAISARDGTKTAAKARTIHVTVTAPKKGR